MSDLDPAGALPPEVFAAIKLQFHQECDEHLSALEAGLLELREGARDCEIINTMFRAAHSIKGGAAMFGMQSLVEISHKLESVLSLYRADRTTPVGRAVEILLCAVDRLSDLISRERTGSNPDIGDSRDVLAALEALAGSGGKQSEGDFDDLAFSPQPVFLADLEPMAQNWTVRLRPLRELFARANDPLVLLRELQSLGAISVVLDETRVPLLANFDPGESYFSWTVTLATAESEQRIRDVFEFVEGDCELDIRICDAPSPPLRAAPAKPVFLVKEGPSARTESETPAPARTIRVDLERVDRLVNLIGELVISESALSECVSNSLAARNTRVSEALDGLRLLTRDLQEGVMAIRAQPIKTVFQRLPRLVRELEAQTGKRVQLELGGEETELDRTVIEGLTDPLTHLIRNAVDHGIEMPDVRARGGKPEIGRIRVCAAHRAGRIVIEIADDGQGIDRARVRDVAVERGLIKGDAVFEETDIDALILEPGFSTKNIVSDISGRGVGMEVVKRDIQALGGRIAIASRPGAGTTMTLSLPLTLAVLDGMHVKSCDQHLIVPLATLLETVQLTAANVRRFGSETDILTVRGSHVPLVDLGHALGFRAPARGSLSGIALLVEDDAGQRLALLIDEIQGQRQVVIKSLETNYRAVDGIAAATILGDGSVALILDINAIVASRRAKPSDRLVANG